MIRWTLIALTIGFVATYSLADDEPMKRNPFAEGSPVFVKKRTEASANAPLPAGAKAGTKVAVFNVAKVMQEFKKWQYFATLLNKKRSAGTEELGKLRTEYTELEARIQKEQIQENKKEIAKSVAAKKKEFETKEAEIRKTLDADSVKYLQMLYEDIQDSVKTVAEKEGIDLVFAYPDAVKPEELKSPLYFDLKLRPPAATPFFISPKSECDISLALIETLNKSFPVPAEGVQPVRRALRVAADDEPKKNPFAKGEGAEDKKPAEPPVPQIAHMTLTGDFDEAPVSGESLFGPPSENMTMKLERIRKAGADERVKALYLQIHDLEVGFGKLNEIRRAIADFRATGKKVFVYSEELGTKEYLIALGCDQVVLPESGGLALYGLRAEVTYYKNALDKLHLKADVLKMGAYKSAVEPYLTDTMSKENREQVSSLLDDNFDHEIVDTMVKARPDRKWTAEKVKAIIDQGPFTAKKAKELGLVDNLAYEDEFEASLAKLAGAPEAKIAWDYAKPKAAENDFSNPLSILGALGGGSKKSRASTEPKIAVIYAIGGIESGRGGGSLMGGSTVGSETLVDAIREADKDPTVKAIVLRVDSPGGSALASDMIWRALKVCKKPVVASMGDVAASGGYYIAMAGQKIFAEPGTITGSIGVFGMKIVTGGLQEWGGVKTEIVSRGKNSGVNSTTFAWSESERAAMTETIEDVYAQFIDKSLAGRKAAGVKMTREELLALAGGRVWTGRQAKANGLVDELGTLEDAIAYAKTLAGIDPKKPMERLELPKGSSFLEKLLAGDIKSPLGSIAAEIRLLPDGEKILKLVGPLLRGQKDPARVTLPYMLEWK